MGNTLQSLQTKFEQTFHFTLNSNQGRDIARLCYEIQRREGVSEENIINALQRDRNIVKAGGRNKFHVLKRGLIRRRFPLTANRQFIDTKDVFLSDLKRSIPSSVRKYTGFVPEKIFIERNARDSYLVKRFRKKFPKAATEELNYCWEYVKKHKFELKDLKRPFVFIVKERWDFIKPCPCTKNHLRCNYWIFNLGFGCPFDCSYCFLQQYTNFPGIVLPANLDDFFNTFGDFYKKINRPIRIGTGEFCDSLALDDITGYAEQLVNFFRDKPLFFELKTKSITIDNLLQATPAANVVISWSLNPPAIIDNEEHNSSTLRQRIESARKIQKKGFSVAFHFDPIIYSPNWENPYKEVIDTLYEHLFPPFSWISLGTLRGTRKLKNTAEIRFPQSTIFYGELLLGMDKKLRYPKFLRKEIYAKMLKWIRRHDTKTPVYLCMEDADCWSVMDEKFSASKEIEQYLLGKK